MAHVSMAAKYDGKCRHCGGSIPKGQPMIYAGRKQAYHPPCHALSHPGVTVKPKRDEDDGHHEFEGAPGQGKDHTPPKRPGMKGRFDTFGQGPGQGQGQGQGQGEGQDDSSRFDSPYKGDGKLEHERTFQVAEVRKPDLEGKDAPVKLRWNTEAQRFQSRTHSGGTFDRLKRTDIWKVLAQEFPQVSGKYWRAKGVTNDLLNESFRSGTVHPDIQRRIKADEAFEAGKDAPQQGQDGISQDDIEKVLEEASKRSEEEQAEWEKKTEKTLKAKITRELKKREVFSFTPPDIPQPAPEDGLLAHYKFPLVVDLVSLGIPPFLFGPAGTGKSTIGRQVALFLSRQHAAESCSPDKDATYLVGYMDGHGKYHGTEFFRLWTEGGVMVIDEADNSDTSVLAVLNDALANGSMVFPGRGTVPKHEGFMIVLCGNTWGSGADSTYIGRTALDAATLDRFFSLEIDIDEVLEDRVALGAIGIENGYAGGTHPVLPDKIERDEETVATDAKAWINRVRKYRDNVAKHGLQVVVSPRASINGCKLVTAGWDFDTIAKGLIFRGLDQDTCELISAGVA
jgi:MoxR-like ATPase